MEFDINKFHANVASKRGGLNCTEAAKKANVTYSCMYRVLAGALPDVPNLVKFLAWLNKPFEYYLKKEALMKK